MRSLRRSRPAACSAFLLVSALVAGPASAAETGSAAALRAHYEKHRSDLAQSRFGKPLHLTSQQTSNTLQGDILAVVDAPFGRVRSALAEPRNWCDILILHPNVKDCRLNSGAGEPSMTVNLGRAELPVQFSYQAAAKTADYLDVRLGSATGPFGTSDYRIQLEATPIDAGRTLLHLEYAHGYGLRAKLAMQAYFNTLGRGKVGFTVVDKNAQGQPVYVSDLRGGLERNAMRYYASIESYLDALSVPAPQQLEKRLRTYFAYTERYPLQLQEEAGYLDSKRKEAQKAQSQS